MSLVYVVRPRLKDKQTDRQTNKAAIEQDRGRHKMTTWEPVEENMKKCSLQARFNMLLTICEECPLGKPGDA